MVVGILVLAGAIGLLVHLSQQKVEVSQTPATDAPKRTKHSIGVHSRSNLKGETTNATTLDSSMTQSVSVNSKRRDKPQPESHQPEKQIAKKTAKVAPAEPKKRRHVETFFEVAPNSGKHAPDNLDRVAN